MDNRVTFKLPRSHVPFPMPACLTMTRREAHMLYALARGLPRLVRVPRHNHWLTICGYGPSLRDSWRDIRPWETVLSVSGAHDFLLDRGIVPTYHLDMDPRSHKVDLIRKPHPDVTYLLASVCHPTVWDKVPAEQIRMWHTDSGDGTFGFLCRHDPGCEVICAGSDAGLAAIHVGGILGHWRFRLHGFDHSLVEGARHAGPHGGFWQKPVNITVNSTGRRFTSTEIMSNAAAEFIGQAHRFPIVVILHGDGLLQDTVRGFTIPNVANAWTWKAFLTRFVRFRERALTLPIPV